MIFKLLQVVCCLLVLCSGLVEVVLGESASRRNSKVSGLSLADIVTEVKGIPKSGIAISVRDVERGQELYSYRATESQLPASVQKIFTSVAALKFLGPDFRFVTEVFGDKQPDDNGYVGRIYVRGHGDPMLTNELMWKLAQEIAGEGVKRVQEVVVDDSLFIDPPGPTGTDPFKAGASATSFNFNCVAVTIAPTGVVRLIPHTGYEVQLLQDANRGADVILDLADPKPMGSERSELSYFIAGTVKVGGTGRNKAETVFRTVNRPAVHFGFGLRDALESAGIDVKGGIVLQVAPSRARKLHTYESPELSEILKNLNRYSSNFSANQVLYALGHADGNENEDGESGVDYNSTRHVSGVYRLDRGIERVKKVIEHSGAALDGIAIIDGSGLDKRNRGTADALSRVLVYAYSDFTVGPYLIASLSRYGSSGTLKNRHLLHGRGMLRMGNARFAKEDAVYGKTGTLDGVSSLAGYAPTRSGKIVAFAIMIQGASSKDTATAFEDKLVQAIIETL